MQVGAKVRSVLSEYAGLVYEVESIRQMTDRVDSAYDYRRILGVMRDAEQTVIATLDARESLWEEVK